MTGSSPGPTRGVDAMYDAVDDILRFAGARAVMPVYRGRAADPREVTPGEWVTAADHASEAIVVPRLRELLPGSSIVAEEAVKADPRVLEALDRDGDVWLVDPLDGTANFARGHGPFRIMVALVRDGTAVASWIHDPKTGEIAFAQRGRGAFIDGQPVHVPDGAVISDSSEVMVLRRFLPPDIGCRVDDADRRHGPFRSGSGCAGADYVSLAQRAGICLYWRTLPWDHVPGALFLNEAGGFASRPDADAYLPREHRRPGLLAATTPALWQQGRDLLFP